MPQQTRAYWDLSLAMVIVGSSVVMGKIIIQAFPVFLASGFRFLAAALIMIPLVWRSEGRLFAFCRRDWGVLFVMAFCGQFVFTVLLLIGLKHTSAVEAGLITSTTPAMMAVLAALILKEPIGWRKAAGALLAVAGVAAAGGLLSPQSLARAEGHLLGNLLICGAVVGEAAFLLLRKTLKPQASDMQATAALVLLGFLMFLVPALFEVGEARLAQAGPVQWGAILYFGAVYTALAYFLWFRGVSATPGAVAGVFTAVMPLSAVGLSWLVLGEPVTGEHLLGAAFVVGAILLTTLEGKPAGPKKAA